MSVQGSNRGGVGSGECLVARTQGSFAVFFLGLTGGISELVFLLIAFFGVGAGLLTLRTWFGEISL